MQIMKSNIEKPYYSDKPLGKNTAWVAFPVRIDVKNTNYTSGLSYGQEIISKLDASLNNIDSENCRIGIPDITEEIFDFETTVEFKKLGNDYYTQLFYQVVVNFSGSLALWNKMALISQYLDAIDAFTEGFSKDKLVDFSLGTTYSFAKK